jgi:threonine/homoserine/homoserine lactone efflux protein
MMVMASGANFGLRRTLPHWAGIVAGFSSLLLACGLGLGGLFTAYPVLHEILKWAGAAYLVYLAIKIATTRSLSATKNGTDAKPMTFLGAVAFQLVNVKAWAMALGATTTYIPAQHYLPNLLVASAVFIAVNIPCMGLWVSSGVVLKRYLERPVVSRTFNIVMAVLLLASLYPLFL